LWQSHCLFSVLHTRNNKNRHVRKWCREGHLPVRNLLKDTNCNKLPEMHTHYNNSGTSFILKTVRLMKKMCFIFSTMFVWNSCPSNKYLLTLHFWCVETNASLCVKCPLLVSDFNWSVLTDITHTKTLQHKIS
jgi:hypothetical protein